MQHIDDDLLTLIALQAEELDAATAAHLQSCAECSNELDSLRRVVAAGKQAPRPSDLINPPDQVWQGIAGSLGLETSEAERPRASAGTHAPGADSVSSLAERRSSRMPTWLAVAAGFVVGAVAAGATVAGVTNDDSGDGTEQLVASAELDPLSDTGTAGLAEVLDVEGHRVLDVRIDDRTPGAGYREVWLLDAEAGRLVSLGVLTGTESRLVIPDGLDLAQFPVVDVSREPFDGDPAHSADSIARGTLDL
ncbi:MAG: anti-sigma factor [Nocardioidaceae bacterium]